jgi:hypothetical protein
MIAVEHIERLSTRVFFRSVGGTATERPPIDFAALIPVLHRFIAEGAFTEEVMVDVADYTHLRRGPLLLLICHKGHLALDDTEAGLALRYSLKRGGPPSLEERIRHCLRVTLQAAKLLDPVQQLPKIATDWIQLTFDDRLRATRETMAPLADFARRAAVTLGPTPVFQVSSKGSSADPIGFELKTDAVTSATLDQLLARLG